MSEYMNEKFDYIINKTDEMIDELIDYFIKDKALLKDYLRKQSKEKEELEQQKNTLEQYLRIEKEVSNETIKELEQQKAELIEALSDERDKLYNNLPSGDIKAWDLLIVIKNHITNIDELFRKHTEEERDER